MKRGEERKGDGEKKERGPFTMIVDLDCDHP
jgi:hypothetical protein